jgi:hypothetical protein
VIGHRRCSAPSIAVARKAAAASEVCTRRTGERWGSPCERLSPATAGRDGWGYGEAPALTLLRTCVVYQRRAAIVGIRANHRGPALRRYDPSCVTDTAGLSGTDALISGVVGAVAQRMTAMQLSGAELRERGHLDPFIKNELERRCGSRPRSQTLRTPDFVGVGPVDVVLADPRALIELKCSYAMPPKIYESVWDAIKLVLLGQRHDYNALYIATGASREAWASSESTDLFDEGQMTPPSCGPESCYPRAPSTTAKQSGRTA